jgi:hypothetical protein
MDSVELKINSWIEDLQNNKLSNKYALLLIGETGYGKCASVKKVLEEKQYYPHVINTSNYCNKNILKDLMGNIINSKQGLLGNTLKKHAIIIDDLDGISINDRGSITEIIEIIKNITARAKQTGIPPLPVVCISNHSYLKKKKDLIKLCIVCDVKIDLVQHKLKIIDIINEWVIKNKITISIDVINYISSESQNDFNRLDNILRYIEISNHKTITRELVTLLLENIHEKTITKHLYDSCKYLLTEKVSIGESLFLFKQERTLLPLMIHENFNNYIDSNDKYTRMLILQSLSKAMIIETLLYNKNEWDLQNIYSFRSCFMPSYLINKNYKKKSKSSCIMYTMLLNKTSLRHTYIHKYRQKIMIKPDINLYFDRNRVSKIIDNYTDDKSDEYLKNYGWTIKDIEDLKKIL